jgi:succinate dehydrogenase hydrophobic anchor subunit
MDRDSLDRKWSRTFILLGHMSGLEEWLLCHSVSDLSNIVSDYSDGVWFREMIQLMTLIVMMVLMI